MLFVGIYKFIAISSVKVADSRLLEEFNLERKTFLENYPNGLKPYNPIYTFYNRVFKNHAQKLIRIYDRLEKFSDSKFKPNPQHKEEISILINTINRIKDLFEAQRQETKVTETKDKNYYSFGEIIKITNLTVDAEYLKELNSNGYENLDSLSDDELLRFFNSDQNKKFHSEKYFLNLVRNEKFRIHSEEDYQYKVVDLTGKLVDLAEDTMREQAGLINAVIVCLEGKELGVKFPLKYVMFKEDSKNKALVIKDIKNKSNKIVQGFQDLLKSYNNETSFKEIILKHLKAVKEMCSDTSS